MADERHLPEKEPVVGLWSSVALVLVLMYAPWIEGAGFICDDWMVVAQVSEHPGLWENYCSWFPLFAARPLAPAVLSAASNLWQTWPAGYAVSLLLFWFASVAELAWLWRRYAGETAAATFVLLAGLPSVASTVVFSVGMQHLAVFSLWLWATSLLLVERAVRHRQHRRRCLIGASLLLFVGLLIYEIFLPLLVFQMAFPWLAERDAAREGGKNSVRERIDRRYVQAYVLPVIGVVLAAVIVQKGIMPQFMPDLSRLDVAGPGGAVRAAVYWAAALVLQIPLLWFDGLFFWGLLEHPWTLAALLLAAGMIWRHSARRGRAHYATARQRRKAVSRKGQTPGIRSDAHPSTAWEVRRALVAMALAAAVLTAGLFVLSGNYAAVYGYDNRMLSSLWVALALAASLIPLRPPVPPPGQHRNAVPRRYWTYRLLLLGLIALAAQSFCIQRDNYLAGWKLQQKILAAFHQQRRATDVPEAVRIVAAVPPAVARNYNDECVFTRPWDLGNALRLQSGGRVEDAVPLYPWLRQQGRIELDGGRIDVDGLWSAKVGEPLWYFEYDLDTGQSQLEPIGTERELRRSVRRATTSVNDVAYGRARRVTESLAAWVRTRWLHRPPLEQPF